MAKLSDEQNETIRKAAKQMAQAEGHDWKSMPKEQRLEFKKKVRASMRDQLRSAERHGQ